MPKAASGPGRPRKEKARQARAQILDSAEQLFAERGFSNVPLRDITKKAGVNVALVNYYFKNKNGLLYAVLERRSAPIIAERHRLLDECVARAGTQDRPNVGEVLAAFMGPIMLARETMPGGEIMQKLFGMALSDPSPDIRRAIHYSYRDIALRFIKILRRACPKLGEEEFYWRVTCVFGAIIFLFAEPGRVQRMIEHDFDDSDKGAAFGYVIPFLEAGMSLPPAPSAAGQRPGAATRADALRVVPAGMAEIDAGGGIGRPGPR